MVLVCNVCMYVIRGQRILVQYFQLKLAKMQQDSDILNIDQRDSTLSIKERIFNVFPIVGHLSEYSVGKAMHDILAGFTVGLTEVPQGIAYATVAGLPPQYGLYSGFMGCFMYAIFGTSKDLNIGPTAIMALMTQSSIEQMGPDVSVLLALLTGCVIFTLGLLRLGFVIGFFSYPVVAGFTCAAAVQIGSSQLKSLFGIPGKANGFLESIINIVENIGETNVCDLILGLSSIFFLIGTRELKRLNEYRPGDDDVHIVRKVLGKSMWFVSLSRNALVVVLGAILAYNLSVNNKSPFTLIDAVHKGLPIFHLPPFSTNFNGIEYSFEKILKNYGGTLIFVPLVSILESVAVAKSFSNGKLLDATQELIALGVCNVMGSFVGSMPVTGSFTRSAVNNASGVKTPLGGIITGSMVLLALVLLTETFSYIPKATLAAVIITAMFYLFDYESVYFLWKTKKLDMIPFIVTFLTSLLIGIEYGILIGISVHLIYVLYPTVRPKIQINLIKVTGVTSSIAKDVYVIIPTKQMHFPVAEYFRETVLTKCILANSFVLIDGQNVEYMDSTVTMNIQLLFDELKVRKQTLILWNFDRDVITLDNNDSDYSLIFNVISKNGTLSEVVT